MRERGRIRVMRREPHPYQRGELVVVIDCSDLARSAEFWAGVLGYAQDGVASGRYQSLLPADGRGAEILLQQVAEASSARTGFILTCAPAILNLSCTGSSASAPGS